jgi:hypothetical protein
MKLIATLAASIVFFAPLAMSAQNPAPHLSYVAQWPADSGRNDTKLILVTPAHPSQRKACHVASFTADSIACKGHFGHTHLYRQSDLLAVIRPRPNDPVLGNVIGVLVFAGLGGGVITGAVLLASVSVVAAIPVAIVGAAIALDTVWFLAGDDEPSHDTLLYLRENTTLQVHLR